jgi:hypothetical protein
VCLTPDRANAHNIGADLTDATGSIASRPTTCCDRRRWLDGFLTKDDFVSLLNRLISHFPQREMAFNSYTSLAVWASKVVRGTKSFAGLLKFPGVNDPDELEGWTPKLKLIREILLTREPEVAEYPTAARLYTRFLATSTTLSRKGAIVLHYRF